MKKISYCLFIITFIVASCQKDNVALNDNNTIANVAQRSEKDQFKYYHNNIEIDEAGFAAIMENTQNIIDIEASPENPNVRLFKTYAFDTKEQYIAFGNTLNLRLDKELEAADHLYQYALNNGIIAHYEATGEMLPSYLTYAENYLQKLYSTQGKSSGRAISFLKKSCSSPELPIIFGAGNAAMSFMPFGWNNETSEISSVNLLGGLMTIYDKSFFYKKLTSLTSGNPFFSNTTICFTTLPQALRDLLDDRMSSGLNLTL